CWLKLAWPWMACAPLGCARACAALRNTAAMATVKAAGGNPATAGLATGRAVKAAPGEREVAGLFTTSTSSRGEVAASPLCWAWCQGASKLAQQYARAQGSRVKTERLQNLRLHRGVQPATAVWRPAGSAPHQRLDLVGLD